MLSFIFSIQVDDTFNSEEYHEFIDALNAEAMERFDKEFDDTMCEFVRDNPKVEKYLKENELEVF